MHSGARSAVIASFLGWTLDAFDFFLVVLCMTSIGDTFHRSDTDMALSITLTLAFRPVGAFLFGMMADRYGRRLPLMIDLIFYSLVEVLTGLAPGYKSFLVLRALFGIGMGGEWGVGAALAMEHSPPKSRGIFSGLLQEGYAAGYLLAAVAYFLIFPRWGWRPLFFIGGLPALLAIYVRLHVPESDVWKKSKHSNWKNWATSIAINWKIMLYITLLMAMMNFSSHGTQDLFPTFLKRDWKLPPKTVAVVTAISMVGAICGGIFFGQLSDRLGRRRAMMTALFLALLTIPLWAFSPKLPMLIAGGFVMQFMVQGAWGVVPAYLTELSPAPVRATAPGLAYQLGGLVTSWNGKGQALAAERWGNYPAVLAITVLVVALSLAGFASLGHEAKGRDMSEA